MFHRLRPTDKIYEALCPRGGRGGQKVASVLQWQEISPQDRWAHIRTMRLKKHRKGGKRLEKNGRSENRE